MNNKKVLVYAFMSLLIVVLIVGVAVVFSSDEVVAKVNGQEISKTELYDSLVKQNGQQALDVLITQKIVDMEVQKKNIVIDQKELDQKIEEFKETYGGEEGLQAALEYSGMSMDDLKRNVELNTKIEKLIAPGISITEEEMKEYFETNKDSFVTPEQKEPTLEGSKEKVKEALLQQKIQTELDPWLQAKRSEYEIVKLI